MAQDTKPGDSHEAPSLAAPSDQDADASEVEANDQATAEQEQASISVDTEQGAGQPSAIEASRPVSGSDTEVTPAPSEPFVPIEKFEALQRQKEELYERLLRKQAEFENFRKRTEKEKQEFYDFALANFLQGLLPVVDGLERGVSVSEGETVESYKKGIELILKQLRDHLASAGVQPIRAMGKIFDPNLHQAVLREESALLPENEVIEEMQRGYTFKDRLLRPSMVKVAVPAAVPEPTSEAAAESAEEVQDQESVQ